MSVKHEGVGQISSTLTNYLYKRGASGLHLLEKRLVGREPPVFVH